jgi:hypothetical protein
MQATVHLEALVAVDTAVEHLINGRFLLIVRWEHIASPDVKGEVLYQKADKNDTKPQGDIVWIVYLGFFC